jgi:hypothetical protein
MVQWEIDTKVRERDESALQHASTQRLNFVRAEFPSHGAIFYGGMGADWIVKTFIPSRLFREWHLPKLAERKGFNRKTYKIVVVGAYACPKSPADPLDVAGLEGTLNRDGRTKVKVKAGAQ